MQWLSDNVVFLVPLFTGVLLALASALAHGGEADDLEADCAGDGGEVPDGDLPELRAPALVVASASFVSAGMVGLMVNLLLGGTFPAVLRVPLALAVAIPGGVLLGRRYARAVVKVFPPVQTWRITRRDLVGRTGTLVERSGLRQTKI